MLEVTQSSKCKEPVLKIQYVSDERFVEKIIIKYVQEPMQNGTNFIVPYYR
eukprot:SAG11_NODE_210_length_12303_cov_10.235824_9_plen_51_part_00